jgi:hypothetical protein
MRTLAAFALVLLAGCSGADRDDEAPDTNEIRRLSTPTNAAAVDNSVSASIEPLRPEDLSGFGEGAALCRFLRNNQLFVAAAPDDAVARIAGALRHFVQTTPPGATGVFLEDRQVSISIGRTDSGGVAARLTVTNRRTGVQERWAGDWRCDRR